MKHLLLALLVGVLMGAGVVRADDLEALAGKWVVERIEVQGKAVPDAELPELVVTITGDRYEVRVKDKIDRGMLKLGRTGMLLTMDATDTEGDDAGKVILAVYEVTGETLRVCYPMDGGPRPTELASPDGSTNLLVTYRREK